MSLESIQKACPKSRKFQIENNYLEASIHICLYICYLVMIKMSKLDKINRIYE